jgi:ubiquinone/menaquinone biosynthesis C-methylase UbiE
MARTLQAFRDRVLANAGIRAGDTLLDAGCGDGLIGFGALDRIGAEGKLLFLDVSQDLLDRCRQTAQSLGVINRCQFIRASADDLSAVASGSVDVVTTRSVLIYVSDKARCFRQFFRVLRPSGRLSIGEPINRFCHPEPPGWLRGYDCTAIVALVSKLDALYERLQPSGTDPMLDFDERDLLRFAQEAGFESIHLDYTAAIAGTPTREDWDTFFNRAGNPRIPTLKEAADEALAPEERERLVAHLRPLVEAGKGTSREAFAYLWARK